MKTSIIKEVLLYRYRFGLGYAVYIIFVSLLLTVGIGSIPHGLTTSEMQSAVTSTQLTPANLLAVPYVDAPYHLSQSLSIHLLGLTPFAIKLPSVVFALLTALALVVMLSRWFKPRIAIITGLIAVTTPPFLAMGRMGIPLIMTAFWLSIILLSATRILHSDKHTMLWKFILALSVGLSLYTPLMIYPLIALAIAGFLHPHVRYVLRHMNLPRTIIAIFLFLLILVPLGWSLFRYPSTSLDLMGVPAVLPSHYQLLDNAIYVIKSLVRVSEQFAGEIITPLFGIVTTIIAALGLLKSGAQWYAARSYMIGLWLLFIIPIIIINPYFLPTLYAPVVLLLAIGIETLIRSWYQLFPRNPYARIAGLLPLSVLIITIALTNSGRYFYGYMYTPQRNNFYTQLEPTHEALASRALKNRPAVLVVAPEQESFYSILKWKYPKLTVQSNPADVSTAIIHESQYGRFSQTLDPVTPYRLYTNAFNVNGLDVRVYTPKDS